MIGELVKNIKKTNIKIDVCLHSGTTSTASGFRETTKKASPKADFNWRSIFF